MVSVSWHLVEVGDVQVFCYVSLKSLALMHSASSPHSEVTVGAIPTTLHGIRIQSQVDCFRLGL